MDQLGATLDAQSKELASLRKQVADLTLQATQSARALQEQVEKAGGGPLSARGASQWVLASELESCKQLESAAKQRAKVRVWREGGEGS